MGIRNRRTPAPAGVPLAGPGAALPEPAQVVATSSAAGPHQSPPPPVVIPEADGDSRERRVLSPLPAGSAEGSPGQDESPSVSSVQPDSPPTEGGAPPPPPSAPAVPIGPPPCMFNPTAIPPPTAALSTSAVSAQSQPPRHPSIAFSVNETVERALKIAEGEKHVAERRAAFWKYRFRDLAVWAASFAILSYASDHGFEDC